MIPSPAKQRNKAPNNPATRTIHNRLPSFLKPDAAVEISTSEDDYRGAWFPGKVVTVPSPDSANCQVEYATMSEVDDESKPLREFVHVDHLRPRPPPMSEAEKKRDIAAGEDVDAFYNGVWWEGTVTEARRGDGKFSVYFRASKEQIQFRRDELRFHREWVNDTWKPPLDETETESEEEESEEVDDDTEDKEVKYILYNFFMSIKLF